VLLGEVGALRNSVGRERLDILAPGIKHLPSALMLTVRIAGFRNVAMPR
jgi:hypothetical protein